MEIVMDIETLEIFEVINSDNQMVSSHVEDTTEKIMEESVIETSREYQYIEEPRGIVQLTLFDDSFYSHLFLFFEDSS